MDSIEEIQLEPVIVEFDPTLFKIHEQSADTVPTEQTLVIIPEEAVQPHITQLNEQRLPADNLENEAFEELTEGHLKMQDKMMMILNALQVDEETARKCHLGTKVADLYYFHFAEQTPLNDELFGEILGHASSVLQCDIRPEYSLKSITMGLCY